MSDTLTALLDRIEAQRGSFVFAAPSSEDMTALLRAARFGVEARKFLRHKDHCDFRDVARLRSDCTCGLTALLAKMTEEG